MTTELRGSHVLEESRGTPAIRRDRIAGVFVSAGELLMQRPEVAEIDRNPVAAGSKTCVALNARIVLRQ